MLKLKTPAAARLACALALGVVAATPCLTIGGAAFAQPTRAHGDPSAEAWVQSEAGRAISILNDRSLGRDARKRAFYDFVNQAVDVPRITNFVLGRYRRQITPAQYQQFSEIFREYADSVYETRLGEYRGESLKVTGSVVHAPGDVVVSSLITGGDYHGQPVVNWRVMRGQDGWKVVDVQAQGVWLAVVEQQDFTSTLANANGDVQTLITQLQRQVRSAAGGNR